MLRGVSGTLLPQEKLCSLEARPHWNRRLPSEEVGLPAYGGRGDEHLLDRHAPGGTDRTLLPTPWTGIEELCYKFQKWRRQWMEIAFIVGYILTDGHCIARV